jgi:hypothetical protein
LYGLVDFDEFFYGGYAIEGDCDEKFSHSYNHFKMAEVQTTEVDRILALLVSLAQQLT